MMDVRRQDKSRFFHRGEFDALQDFLVQHKPRNFERTMQGVSKVASIRLNRAQLPKWKDWLTPDYDCESKMLGYVSQNNSLNSINAPMIKESS